MNIENIQKMWEQDSHIDSSKLEEESTRVPQLHQRYMEHFNTFSLMKREKELELNQLRKEKWIYYKGKAPSSVYKFQPFDLKLTTSDEIKMFINADDDVCKLEYKITYLTTMLNYIESILKQINNRGFQIKNAIDWEKFQAGF